MLFLRAEEETSGWGGAGKGSFLEGSICNQGLEEVWGLDGQLEHGTVPGPGSRAPGNETDLVRS